MVMSLVDVLRRSADHLLTPYLDAPTPQSLQMVPAQGERESLTIEDKTCFVYVLLTASEQRYEDGYDIPALPRKIRKLTPTFRNKLRYLVRDRQIYPDVPAIEQKLEEALSECGIIQYREGVYGIFGITESELRHLIYLPAETSAQADVKMNAYRERVNQILQPNRLVCALKIKPLVKPGKILLVPDSLDKSYFGWGC